MDVTFQKPQVLVGLTGNTREQIRRIGIAKAGRLVDSRANLPAEVCQHCSQCFNVRKPVNDVLRVRLQGRAARSRDQRTVRPATQGRDALGNGIDVVFDGLGNLVRIGMIKGVYCVEGRGFPQVADSSIVAVATDTRGREGARGGKENAQP
jgi:hypothetical protein